MVDIKVPALGESITSAIVAKWHKKPGEPVKADELLLELETDKITLEVPAPSSGVLSEIRAAEGATVVIGDILGAIAEGKAAELQPVASVASVKQSAPAETEKVLSPAADKVSRELDINPDAIQGTAKGGRVTKEDVLAANQKGAGVVVASQSNEERVKISPLRKKIAERLKESQNTAAILTTFNEIDMSRVIATRKKYGEQIEKQHGVKLGFMSFFVKAVVATLKEIPGVNAEIDGDYIVYKNYYNIGMAVGTEQGLVVPVLRNAENMTMIAVEKEIALLAKKARDGKLTMADLQGGTFTITNGGIYGSLMSTPILNPPQSGILGLHKIMDRPVVEDGQVVIRPMMYLALSYDHRLIDGREAVTFLVKIKEYIENPERLLLEV